MDGILASLMGSPKTIVLENRVSFPGVRRSEGLPALIEAGLQTLSILHFWKCVHTLLIIPLLGQPACFRAAWERGLRTLSADEAFKRDDAGRVGFDHIGEDCLVAEAATLEFVPPSLDQVA